MSKRQAWFFSLNCRAQRIAGTPAGNFKRVANHPKTNRAHTAKENQRPKKYKAVSQRRRRGSLISTSWVRSISLLPTRVPITKIGLSSSSRRTVDTLLPTMVITEEEKAAVSSSSPFLSKKNSVNTDNNEHMIVFGPPENRRTNRAAAAAVVASRPSSLSRSPSSDDMDELDLLICHEEFEKLVALMEKVKHTQVQILNRHAPPAGSSASGDNQSSAAWQHYQHCRPHVAKSCLAPEEVLCVVERLREQLVSPGSAHANIKVRRGAYPVTDATMDDNFSILQKELEFCEKCLQLHHNPTTPPRSTSAYPPPPPASATSCSNSTKYSKWQSDILLQWLVEHHKDPTLSKCQAKELAYRTGLTTTQVSTWLQNMRRRRRKNTIEGTKKATHFFDFLFLANERGINGGVLPSHIEIEGLSTGASSRNSTPKRKASFLSSSSSSSSWDYPPRDYAPYTHLGEKTIPFVPIENRSEEMTISSSDTAATAAFANMAPRTVQTKSSWDGEDLSFAGVQDNDSLFDGLQTVTESIDEEEQSLIPTYDDCMIERASLDFEVDEDLLSVFASTWHETPDHNSRLPLSPPPPPPSYLSSNRPINDYCLSCPPLRVAADKKQLPFQPQENESRDDYDGHDDFHENTLDWMDLDSTPYEVDYDLGDISPASFFRKSFIAIEKTDDDDGDDKQLDHDLSFFGLEQSVIGTCSTAGAFT